MYKSFAEGYLEPTPRVDIVHNENEGKNFRMRLTEMH